MEPDVLVMMAGEIALALVRDMGLSGSVIARQAYVWRRTVRHSPP
jgi:hypothetical protein